MPLELSRLMDTVTAFEEQRKQLGEELLAHRLAIVDAAIKEVEECDSHLAKLGVPIPPSPFAAINKPAKATKRNPAKVTKPTAQRRGITKEAMWQELRRFFRENGPLTEGELWDLAEDHCDKEGITLGVRMVFDRTLNDPKFLQEFQGVLKRTGTPQVQPPQSSDSASV